MVCSRVGLMKVIKTGEVKAGFFPPNNNGPSFHVKINLQEATN